MLRMYLPVMTVKKEINFDITGWMEVDRHSPKKKKWDISVYQAQSKSNLSVYAYCSRCKDGCCAENNIWTTTRLLAVVWKVITDGR